jgi:SAM-dependent methyltransferase
MVSPPPLTATDRPWNSATTLYIARRLHAIRGGGSLRVLDMGCGDGTIIELLQGLGHDLCGYDLASRDEALESRLRPVLGDEIEQRIRMAPDERTIPFGDDEFDVVYANQVFEHIRYFSTMWAECERVLRPGGTLITLFPLATDPVELHLRIPFPHWMPPGKLRAAWMWPFYVTRLRPRKPGVSAWQTALGQDRALARGTFYRFLNEVKTLAGYHFETFEIDTRAFIQAKLDLLAARGRFVRRALMAPLASRLGAALVTHGLCGAFVMTGPKNKAPR